MFIRNDVPPLEIFLFFLWLLHYMSPRNIHQFSTQGTNQQWIESWSCCCCAAASLDCSASILNHNAQIVKGTSSLIPSANAVSNKSFWFDCWRFIWWWCSFPFSIQKEALAGKWPTRSGHYNHTVSEARLLLYLMIRGTFVPMRLYYFLFCKALT